MWQRTLRHELAGQSRMLQNHPGPQRRHLLPCPEESVNFDTTENLIIEGDNLEVLKLLQKSYLGKVKMIYIDPPYNTGNDFIYPDNYTESLQTYLEYTGQVDDEGKKVWHKQRHRRAFPFPMDEYDVSKVVFGEESITRRWSYFY